MPSFFKPPTVSFQKKFGPFLVKVAESNEEILQALRLRHFVFYLEGPGISPKGSLDWDEFDLLCDHLIVTEEKTGLVVATYRLLHQGPKLLSPNQFETNMFYQLEDFLQQKNIMEIGCVCVHPDFRRGSVISILWRGLGIYIRESKTDFVFGMTSFFWNELNPLLDAYLFFENEGFIYDEWFEPQAAFQIADFADKVKKKKENDLILDPKKIFFNLPPLCRSYLKAGARIAGLPCSDPELGCYSILTIMDVNRSAPITKQHYLSV